MKEKLVCYRLGILIPRWRALKPLDLMNGRPPLEDFLSGSHGIRIFTKLWLTNNMLPQRNVMLPPLLGHNQFTFWLCLVRI
jgi:hypothetical protein